MSLDKQTVRLVVKLTYIFQDNKMGTAKGAGPRINEQFPKAVPLWCATHQLNRVIVQSCSEPPIRNMIGTIDSVSKMIMFFFTCNFY